MLQALKRKTLFANVGLLALLAALLILGGVAFGKPLMMLLQGPTRFEPLEDNDIEALYGRYAEADVDTLIDYYAETVSGSGSSQRVTSREYIMPVNTPERTVFIGLELPAALVDDADAVVADTERYFEDDDYEWDGSHLLVQGTIRPMDEETQEMYAEYWGVSADFLDEPFLPMVLVYGAVGSADSGVLPVACIAGLALVAIFVYILVKSLAGGYQKQIRNYVAACADPDGAMQELERLYEDSGDGGVLHMNRRWLLYSSGRYSWVLAADDIVWAYPHLMRRKMYGVVTVGKTYSVKVCGAKEKKNARTHNIPTRSEADSQALLAAMEQLYPNAVYGYTADTERRYNTDPAALLAETRAAHSRDAAQPQ